MISSSNRLAKAWQRNPALADAAVTLLEVCADGERAESLLGRPVTRAPLDGREPLPLDAKHLALALPDGRFDIVLAHGLFEYIPASQRKAMVEALLGKASTKLIIICTCDKMAAGTDSILAAVLRASGRSPGPHLEYRTTRGCPSVRDIFRPLQLAGSRFSVLGNQSVMQHQAGEMMDAFYPLTTNLMDVHRGKYPQGAPIGESEWDQYYDFLFEAAPPAGAAAQAAPPAGEDDRPRLPGARLYAVTHQPGAQADLGTVTPIYVGRAAESAPPGSVTDIVHSVPPLDNSRWCELTAMYKIWKEGPVSEAVGFCHYRRLLDFRHTESRIREIEIDRHELRRRLPDLEFDPRRVSPFGDNWVVTAFSRPAPMTIWDGYCLAHGTMDYCRLLNVIGRRHPYLMPVVSQQFGANATYSNNLFVLPWRLFAEVCGIWFDVFGEYERETPRHQATVYQNRDIGFLSERVFDIWVRFRKQQGTTVIEHPLYQVTDEDATAR
jgi:hypothetical protein